VVEDLKKNFEKGHFPTMSNERYAQGRGGQRFPSFPPTYAEIGHKFRLGDEIDEEVGNTEGVN